MRQAAAEQLVAYAQTAEEKAVAIAKHKALLQKMLDLDDEIQHDLAVVVWMTHGFVCNLCKENTSWQAMFVIKTKNTSRLLPHTYTRTQTHTHQ